MSVCAYNIYIYIYSREYVYSLERNKGVQCRNIMIFFSFFFPVEFLYIFNFSVETQDSWKQISLKNMQFGHKVLISHR